MSIGVVFGCVSGYFDNYLNNKLQNFMHILSKITAISQEILEKKIWFAGNGKKNATLDIVTVKSFGRIHNYNQAVRAHFIVKHIENRI